MPITAGLACGFGALLLAAVAIVYVVALGVPARNTSDLVRDITGLVMSSLVARIDAHLAPARAQATFLAERIADGTLDTRDEAAFLTFMTATLAASPQTFGILFAADDGVRLNAARTVDGVVAGRFENPSPVIEEAINQARSADGPFWGELIYVEEAGETVVNLRVPVRRDGVYLGMVAVATRITELSDFVFDLSGDLRVIAFILHDRDNVLAHPMLTSEFPGLSESRPLPRIADFSDPVLSAMWKPGWEANREPELLGNGHTADVGNEPYAFVYEEIDGYADKPWLIGYYLSIDDVDEPFLRVVRAAGFGIAVAFVAIIAVFFVGLRISRPIRRLAKEAGHVRDLEFAAATPLPRSLFRETDDAAQAFNAMLEGLRWFESYVPKSLVQRLMRQGKLGMIESELRSLTVLFTDIRGFTPLAETMTANETASFLNHHFDMVAACVEQEGGTVDKYIGDAVMAFWGAPEAQSDHGARACRAALAIREAVGRDNLRRQAKGDQKVCMRIGIHTGDAVVGNIGSKSRINYTLVGDTVNTANRIEQLAKELDMPGDEDVHILISGVTAATLPPDIATKRSFGKHALRGREQHIEILSLT